MILLWLSILLWLFMGCGICYIFQKLEPENIRIQDIPVFVARIVLWPFGLMELFHTIQRCCELEKYYIYHREHGWFYDGRPKSERTD